MPAPTAPFRPVNRATLIYFDAPEIPVEYRTANSLVLLAGGRPLQVVPSNPGQQEAFDAGACLGYYFDAIVRNTVGHVHGSMFEDSFLGPAIPDGGHGTVHGPAADIRSSAAQDKVMATLRYVLDNNPLLRWIMLDDGGPNWSGYWSMGHDLREEYYQAIVALFTRIRAEVDARGLFMMVNGVWDGRGAVESPDGPLLGFGYHPEDPDPTSAESRNRHGTTLAHMFMQENIDWSDFWEHYSGTDVGATNAKVGRWGMTDTEGRYGHFAIMREQWQLDIAVDDPDFHTGWATMEGDASAHGEPRLPPDRPVRDIGLAEAEPPPEGGDVLPPNSITVDADGFVTVDLPDDPERGYVAVNVRTNQHGDEQHPGWGEGAPYGADETTLADGWVLWATDDGTAKLVTGHLSEGLDAANQPTVVGDLRYLRAFTFHVDSPQLPFPPASITGDPMIEFLSFPDNTAPEQVTIPEAPAEPDPCQECEDDLAACQNDLAAVTAERDAALQKIADAQAILGA